MQTEASKPLRRPLFLHKPTANQVSAVTAACMQPSIQHNAAQRVQQVEESIEGSPEAAGSHTVKPHGRGTASNQLLEAFKARLCMAAATQHAPSHGSLATNVEETGQSPSEFVARTQLEGHASRDIAEAAAGGVSTCNRLMTHAQQTPVGLRTTGARAI
jgi:hypothetical protein